MEPHILKEIVQKLVECVWMIITIIQEMTSDGNDIQLAIRESENGKHNSEILHIKRIFVVTLMLFKLYSNYIQIIK